MDAQGGQEVGRVSGGVLNNSVDYAGEIGAPQSRLDDKIGGVSEKVKTPGDDMG